MQTFVNLIYGATAALGCYALGVPYPIVWGALGGALRFIPYVGPVIGAGAPILVSLAALPGWVDPFWVIAFYGVLEVFTNLVLETKLYAGAAGVSQVALLVSVAFWTFLWGPLGLLMATPLTVCLVVMGKHVPGLRFVDAMMTDSPAIAPEYGYYQRLLSRDIAEAADLIDRYVKTESPLTLYDGLMLPALNYAERDRLEQRLSFDERDAVIESTRELLPDAIEAMRRQVADAAPDAPPAPLQMPLRVLVVPIGGTSDEVAVAMLADFVEDAGIVVERVAPASAAELVSLVRAKQVTAVCFADMPPSASSKTRHLIRRLHQAHADVRIIVGRWAPPAMMDTATQPLRDAGATFVAATFAETRSYLETLIETPQEEQARVRARARRHGALRHAHWRDAHCGLGRGAPRTGEVFLISNAPFASDLCSAHRHHRARQGGCHPFAHGNSRRRQRPCARYRAGGHSRRAGPGAPRRAHRRHEVVVAAHRPAAEGARTRRADPVHRDFQR
jgi:hypothetical protein